MKKTKGKIQVGVIGIGFGQQVHVPAFRADPRCKVVAICASTQKRAKTIAARLDIPKAFGDWHEIVKDETIDVVTVATPPLIQPEIAISALAYGKAVFCEKPLATSKSAAHKMVVAAQHANTANMIDFGFPEIEAWQKAKSILDNGGIGNLRHVALSWNVETYANKMGLNSWKTQSEMGGGTLNSFVSHTFHYIEWLTGPICRVSANLFRTPGDTRTGDTFVVLCLELESGTGVSLSISSHAFLGHGHRLEFYGDDGTLVLDNSTSDYMNGFRLLYGTRASNHLEVIYSDNHQTSGGEGRISIVARLAKRLLDWVETGKSTTPTFEEGLRVQSLLEAAQKSHKHGSWVQV